MNKKGLDAMKTVGGIILVLVMLGVYLYFTSYAASGGQGFIDTLQGSRHDYDGDGTPDTADECPCGSPPNQKDLKDFFDDGVQRCIQQFSECHEKYEEYGFVTETDARDREVCAYTKQQCLTFIKDYQENK